MGKAVTVYPDQGRPETAVALAGALADALSGLAAPVVRSDRRVRADAPVHYRYGPFLPRYRFDDDGRAELVVTGPEGHEFPGAAGPVYRCPPWVTDPFTTSSAGTAVASGVLLGGRYRPVAGIQRTARGNVYRAEDTRTGAPVVIKEAYAWVDEKSDGHDVRGHLRNERRILEVLDGMPGVPRFVDHFRHGEDEFLVTGDLGEETLSADVAARGLYLDPGDTRPPLVARADGRTLSGLAEGLLRLLDRIHARGVIVRDLAPKNVVISPDGGLHLIDFDLAHHAGVQCAGHTPGYAPPGQRDNPPARAEDDYYALGATLFHAATGLQPVVADDGEQPCTAATLDCLTAVHPALTSGEAKGALALIPGLLSEESAARAEAAAALRAGPPPRTVARRSAHAAPAPPPACTDERLTASAERLLHRLHRHAARPADDTGTPLPTCVYRGTAGVAMELLQHPDTTSRQGALRLARRAARPGPAGTPPPGLMFGGTGTAVVLATTATHPGAADAEDLLHAAHRLAPPDPSRLPSAADARDDHTHGLAGIGTAHLLLATLTGDDRHLDVADACARRLLDAGCRRAADTPGSGASALHGFAHGTAGLVAFALAHRSALGPDRRTDRALEDWIAQLARQTRQSIADTTGPGVRPLAGSWCQGLSGMGTALLRAAHDLDRPDYADLAERAARAALHVAPRMTAVNQCCGLAGLGEFLLDLARTTGRPDHWRARARHVAALVLTRSPDPGREPALCHDPRPVDDPSADRRTAWATGDAGVLGFLRRLRDDGDRLWTPAASARVPRVSGPGTV
ncbi:hypothetical protein EKH77_27055 [Streptomyces luteoverticillatus]|uniref:non-specific serine/threonine protein kinase n=1 Tax=Streptomyces luteoverticillatus TaxID=66425 RepID=A0A3Q9G2E0_STRLT|nr:lanthionine synthetase LanC family protein [Streptomyces luteoverticillatus]AZQ74379.1 hypothetical protein EKH77_27055 [Streptomyces luteoverticillatus]